jgi:membrane protein required for colicin V production
LKILDIILVAIILFGAYKGYKKGFLLEILSFFAFLIAILTAFKLLNAGIDFIQEHFEFTSRYLPVIAFVIIFIVVLIGIHLLNKLLKKIIDVTFLGTFDNLAGAALGAVKMAFFVSLILWLVHFAHLAESIGAVNESNLFMPMVSFAPKVIEWITVVLPFQDILPLIKENLHGQ